MRKTTTVFSERSLNLPEPSFFYSVVTVPDVVGYDRLSRSMSIKKETDYRITRLLFILILEKY